MMTRRFLRDDDGTVKYFYTVVVNKSQPSERQLGNKYLKT